ncbi:Gamma-aminobutyric acid receptor-associated -like 2 [Brachionus plicatilis]|uniref:Gamma-aminobutyric acid receptor-associated-like 2 n=1 Tax=Brachionus plicatilis TaxID=10195 RepID=A0A3M7SDC0_BRAPC|nr:Gamma-aminobutyric acid receptor-associated -like 2 [Brachionus plicatilis]
MRWKYKEEKSFEERFEEATRVKAKYYNRIPIIVEKRNESKLPDLPISKFLVERDSTVAHFLYSVKKRLPPSASQETIFFFVSRNMVVLSSRMGELYNRYKDKDEFLYMSYSEENVFGK